MTYDFRNTEEWIENEMEIDRLRFEIAQERAEELVRDRGWSEEDDDFWFQVEDEEKRQLEEDFEREMDKRGFSDDLQFPEEPCKIRT